MNAQINEEVLARARAEVATKLQAIIDRAILGGVLSEAARECQIEWPDLATAPDLHTAADRERLFAARDELVGLADGAPARLPSVHKLQDLLDLEADIVAVKGLIASADTVELKVSDTVPAGELFLIPPYQIFGIPGLEPFPVYVVCHPHSEPKAREALRLMGANVQEADG